MTMTVEVMMTVSTLLPPLTLALLVLAVDDAAAVDNGEEVMLLAVEGALVPDDVVGIETEELLEIIEELLAEDSTEETALSDVARLVVLFTVVLVIVGATEGGFERLGGAPDVLLIDTEVDRLLVVDGAVEETELTTGSAVDTSLAELDELVVGEGVPDDGGSDDGDVGGTDDDVVELVTKGGGTVTVDVVAVTLELDAGLVVTVIVIVDACDNVFVCVLDATFDTLELIPEAEALDAEVDGLNTELGDEKGVVIEVVPDITGGEPFGGINIEELPKSGLKLERGSWSGVEKVETTGSAACAAMRGPSSDASASEVAHLDGYEGIL